MPRLVITKGEGVGRDASLSGECVVGRGADVDFVLTDTLASRRHVRLSKDGAAWVAEDLGSRNGTLVNGQRVQRQGLKDGDLLRVGGTEMIFRDEATPAGAPKAVVVPAVVKAPGSGEATVEAPGMPGAPGKKPLPKLIPGRGNR
jgi:pSer/pThr/pTyr-binding forkhead associated (FHA) protein